jgi:alkylhydroperoxidase/carboxymuconolactone decarboxylase family protein YurZ
MMLDELERWVTAGRTHSAELLSGRDAGFREVTERLFGRNLRPQWLSETRFAAVTLALDSLTMQLDPQRLRERLKAALTVLDMDQALTVLQLVSVAGLHSVSTGAPILLEEFEKVAGPRPLSESERRIKHAFESSGPRPRRMDPMYESILKLDADYFEAFRAWIDHPWKAGTLDHGTLHLVCIAIDIACTHLYESGFRRHVREAFACGVTAQEVLEVIQLASLEGLRTVFIGTEMLARSQDSSVG